MNDERECKDISISIQVCLLTAIDQLSEQITLSTFLDIYYGYGYRAFLLIKKEVIFDLWLTKDLIKQKNFSQKLFISMYF